MRTHLVLSGLFSAALAFAPQIAQATPSKTVATATTAGATKTMVDDALSSLSSSVTNTSHPDALRHENAKGKYSLA